MKQRQTALILPGLFLSFSVAVIARIMALAVPKLGGATLAILLGIILGNTLFKQERYQVGTKVAESRLKAGHPGCTLGLLAQVFQASELPERRIGCFPR